MGGPTEEWGAVVDEPEPVGVDFGSVDALPLPVGLEILLESLQASRMQHTPPVHGTLAERYHRHDREHVRGRLGFAVPRLSGLVGLGRVELVATADGDAVVAPSEVEPGQSASITVLYLPDEAALNRPGRLDRAAGVTTLDVLYGHTGAGDPVEAPRTRRSTASGDSTVVDVRGYRIGVQHRRKASTRLAWGQQFGDVPCALVVHSPRPPRRAVEMLVQCDLLRHSDEHALR